MLNKTEGGKLKGKEKNGTAEFSDLQWMIEMTLETVTERRRNGEVKRKRRYVKMEEEKKEEEHSSVT